MSSRRFAAAVLAFLFLAACVYAGVGTSGANFSAGRSNLGSVRAGDWVAPLVTLTTPAASARLDSAGKPTFSGAAGTVAGDSTTVTVRIYSGSGTGGTQAQALPATAAGATWSATPTIALPDGTYTAQAEQSDAAGNVGRSAAVTFVVDTTAPAPTVTSPTGSVQTPSFTGTAGNAAGDATTVAVKIYNSGGTVVQSPTPARTGTTWTATVPTLAEGDYTITVSQSDDLGHTGTSSAQSFTVDRTAPAVTVTAPTAGSATNASTPVFSGARGTATGDAAAVTVRLYAGAGTGGTLLQTRAATVTGATWSVASASSLADGTYTVQASQADAAANTGTSTAITFTVDTVSPSPTVTAPTGYTGATPTLSGTAGNATGDATTVTVQILSGATVVQTLTPTRTGTTWTTTAATLAPGAYTAQVRQADSAGNAGLSSSVAFTVDTVAPSVAVTAPAAASFTNSSTPTLSGTAGTAAGDLTTVTVRVYSGASTAGTLLQTRTATASAGAWSVAATALPSNGQYTVQATQPDAAGNTGTSTAVTFTYDTVAPAAPTVTAPSTWATTQTPTITGTAANGTGDNATVTVEVLSGASVVQTLTATRSGTTWSVAVPVALTEGGAYTVRARQGDAAGNTSANSTALGFTVDTIAPVVTLTAPATGTYTNVTTPALSGAAGNVANDSPTVTVRIYNAGGTVVQTLTPTRSGATWSATAAALAQGTYTVQASQSDSAGNVGTSTTNTLTIDTTAPTATNVTTTNVAGGTAGSLDAGDTISFTFSEAMDPASIVAGWNGTGTQSVTLNWTNTANNDWFSVTNAANSAHLATTVSMGANFLKKNWTTTGTLTRTSATTYTITLDATPPNNVAGNGTAPGANIAWTPDTGAKDLAGNAVTAATFTQTGNGVDF
jgi:hypothetical protein